MKKDMETIGIPQMGVIGAPMGGGTGSGGGGGTGAVDSVNGQTGVVVLDAEDVGAVKSINGQSGEVILDAEDVGAATPAQVQNVADDVATNTQDIAILQAAYAGLTQSDIIPLTSLPESGVANTIYRIASTDSYSDYMWDGSQFVLLATYDNGIDDYPTEGSNNLVKSGGVAYADKLLMSGDKVGGEQFSIVNSGKYMNTATVGATATEGLSNNLGYIQIPVIAGDYFIVQVTPGTSARSYAFTDGDLKILSNTNQAFTNFPILIKAEYDGYLIINNLFNYTPNPKVIKITTGVSGKFNITNGSGYVINKTVNAAATLSTSATWGNIYIPMTQGQKATIYTVGGSNGRAWSFLKEGNVVLSCADANVNSIVTPVTVTATQTCVLVVNNNFGSSDNPKIIVDGKPYLEDLDARVTALESLQPKALRILAIGNSFTEDSLQYMSDFLTNLTISNVTVYRVTYGSSSIENWWTRYQNNNTYTPTKVCGETIDNIGNTLKTIFAHDWDYIVFQQLSSDSATYSTIEPNLYSLIAHARKDCTNPLCKIAWHLTWSWSSLNTGTGPKGVDGFNSIASCVEDILDYYRNAGIDVVIPAGTAMQNARGTTLNNTAELTKDYQHAGAGVAKYILCATWYEILIKDFTKISAMSSTLNVSATASSSDLGAESVDDNNRNLCLTCVEYAISNPYHVSTIVE